MIGTFDTTGTVQALGVGVALMVYGGEEAPLSGPMAEYTIEDRRIEYTLEGRRPEYTLQGKRLEYTLERA